MRTRTTIVCLLAAAVAVGCFDRDLDGVEPVVQSQSVVEVVPPPRNAVDLLLVVDNSGSMAAEQDALAEQLPGLVRELMEPTNPAWVPVDDLRIGVISTDLGTNGVELTTCNNGLDGWAGGDRGCLLQRPSGAGCAPTYPRYLARDGTNAATYSPERMAADAACLATLGTRGCGLERQLDAARTAVVDRTRPGECNDGFLRDDAVLAVVVLSDEEDCSFEDDRIAGAPVGELGSYGLRCAYNPGMMKPARRLVEEIRSSRPNPDAVVFLMVVGVPVGPACEGMGNDIGRCLDEPAMRYEADPTNPSELRPACTHPAGWGSATPGRRFVEAAQGLGNRAAVRSICNEDWRPATDAVLQLIQGAFEDVCFPRELQFDAERCEASCTVYETLSDDRPCPAGRVEAVPPTQVVEGRTHRRCLVPQAERAPSAGGCGVPAGEGWYYVPASESDIHCDQVRFSTGVIPEPLSDVRLECLSYVCPAERRCGSAAAPGSRCCGEGSRCIDADPLLGGTCVPL